MFVSVSSGIYLFSADREGGVRCSFFLGEDQGPPAINHIFGFSSRAARGTWMGTVPSLVLKQVVHKSLPLKATKYNDNNCEQGVRSVCQRSGIWEWG